MCHICNRGAKKAPRPGKLCSLEAPSIAKNVSLLQQMSQKLVQKTISLHSRSGAFGASAARSASSKKSNARRGRYFWLHASLERGQTCLKVDHFFVKGLEIWLCRRPCHPDGKCMIVPATGSRFLNYKIGQLEINSAFFNAANGAAKSLKKRRESKNS